MAMNEFEKSILQILSDHPGLKAREIADLLHCERKAVNSALYSSLKSRCYQDSSYRWYLRGEKKATESQTSNVPPDKTLSDLCAYYLNCLSLEDNTGVNAFLTNEKFPDSLNYTELASITMDKPDENTARLIKKVSAERKLAAYVGYPVMIEKVHSSKRNQDYFFVTPVFLFSVEISGGAVSVSHVPALNMKVIRRYSSKDINQQVYDLIELENDLGLNTEGEDIAIDEMAARLQDIRSWEWKETLDPTALTSNPPLKDLQEEGIYNRAVFIIAEKSPYTAGLETELASLAKLDEASYKNTALYKWVHPEQDSSAQQVFDDMPLLEVLPMNSEQEQAVRHGLQDTVTVVTGPPGTGKSQVVTDLVVNAAWQGRNILFTSKNNKAVDVVDARVNSLARRPVMLRIGGNQYAHHLADLISDMLAYSAEENEQQEYAYYHTLYQEKLNAYHSIKEEKNAAIALRNAADHMEQKVCNLRGKWGKYFSSITETESEECNRTFQQYCANYESWKQARDSFFGRLFWFLIGKDKTEALNRNLKRLNAYFQKYELQELSSDSTSLDSTTHQKIYEQGKQLVYILGTICEYEQVLQDLETKGNFEKLDHQIMSIKFSLSELAEKLWNHWLAVRTLKLDASTRREMNDYVSSMRLLEDVDLNGHPELKKDFYRLQKKMTSFLPCWAVTSLSAKGKVPFAPGIFDLVIIDEASQCDIASALPMLYRAKRAVILGDPKQLSHISTVSKKQDASLLQKHHVSPGWSYSANSLYMRASSLTDTNHIIHLRDHFRSFGDIIEFSNEEFYDHKLRVATNYEKLVCPPNAKPGIRWINVVGKTVRPVSGSAYNEQEVAAIVKELQRLILQDGYTGSVGVVTPFRAQAEKIRDAIAKIPDLQAALLKNKFLVDTVHKFQGDEKDLMFFSLVISQETGQGALTFLRNTGNLFNVAITRARAVLAAVGDMEYCSKCGIPYMEHFVKYVNDIQTKKAKEKGLLLTKYPEGREYPNVANPEQVSDWERYFYTALFDQGIRTIPQYPVDKYKLDLAIIKEERKLDIEVDGEMYHKDWNGELCYRDQLRNERLFELGWDVKRFWVYQIRDDLQKCIDEIKQWIDKTPTK